MDNETRDRMDKAAGVMDVSDLDAQNICGGTWGAIVTAAGKFGNTQQGQKLTEFSK